MTGCILCGNQFDGDNFIQINSKLHGNKSLSELIAAYLPFIEVCFSNFLCIHNRNIEIDHNLFIYRLT